jgi:hypothetical protein
MKSVVVEGIKYVILEEQKLEGKMAEQGFYVTMLFLRRPKGTLQFWAMRDINGVVTLN